MADNTLASAWGIIGAPIVDPGTGKMTWTFMKWFQDATTRIQSSLDQSGQFNGTIAASTKVGSRPEGIGTTLQNIDSSGIITAGGIDFSRSYANKDTDHINDGSGNPLAGGKTAYSALVASSPTAGKGIIYNGSAWVLTILPITLAKVAHQWIDSYNSTTGTFTQSQPAFTDISGTVAASQLPTPTTSTLGGIQAVNSVAHQWISWIDSSGVPHLSQPAFSDVSGSLAAGQLPASVPVISFGTGAPAGSSTEGYIYYDTTGSPYHGYVYHSGAWHQFS